MRDRLCEGVVVEGIEVPAAEHAIDVDADVATNLCGHCPIVAGDDLDHDAEVVELADRRSGIGLRAIDEREKSDEGQLALIVGTRIASRRRVGQAPGCDRYYSRTVGEQPGESGRRARRRANTASQDHFGCSLRDKH